MLAQVKWVTLMRRMVAGMLVALLFAGVVGVTVTAWPKAAAAQPVYVPNTLPSGGGTADVDSTARSLFDEVTRWVLIFSGGVLTIVIAMIGFNLITKRDQRSRAESYEWLMHVAIGAGFIFGAAFVVRLLVGLYTNALS